MTTYPPFDALRARIREARAQGVRVTSPSLATRRFQVIAETVIGPMLRHVAHVLWQEGVPASVISELGADPSHVAVRVDEEAVAIYFWASVDPDQLRWAIHGRDGYGPTHAVPYDFLSAAHLASLLEQGLALLLGFSTPAGGRTMQDPGDVPSDTGCTSHHEPRL